MDYLVGSVRCDVADLSPAAVQMVAALCSLEDQFPACMRRWLLDELGRCAPLSPVSPAAEALMRMWEFSPYADAEFGQREIEAQYTLIRAVGLEGELQVAIHFMDRFARHLQFAMELASGGDPALTPESQRPAQAAGRDAAP